jgi:hypothetical protein
VDAGNRLGALAHRGRNPLDGAGANVADGEYAGEAGLEVMGLGDAGRRAGPNEALGVAIDAGALQPVGVGIR